MADSPLGLGSLLSVWGAPNDPFRSTYVQAPDTLTLLVYMLPVKVRGWPSYDL